MPKKNKNLSDSEDSDSGPEDRNPPKKAKSEKPEKSSKPSKTSRKSSNDNEEEPTWVLDKNRLVKLREFRGKLLLDIREFYEKDGDLLPGKKGIALSLQQWRKLVDQVSEIDEAIKERA